MQNDRLVHKLETLKSRWLKARPELDVGAAAEKDVLTQLNALQACVETGSFIEQQTEAHALGVLLWDVAMRETSSVSNLELYNVVFHIRLFLANHWPKNRRDYDGCLLDPIDDARLALDLQDSIALSSGYLIKKSVLNKTYEASRHGNFDPMTLQSLSTREVQHLKRQGVKTLLPDPVTDYGIIPRASLSGRFARMGRALGEIVLFLFIVIVDMSPLVMLSLSATAFIAGIFGSRRRGIEGFFTGYFFAYVGGYVATLTLTLLIVPAIGLLTSYSVIPVSAALWAESAWSIIQPCIPAVILVVGVVGELLSRFSVAAIFVDALVVSVNVICGPIQFIGARIDNIIDFFWRLGRRSSDSAVLEVDEVPSILECTTSYSQMLQALEQGENAHSLSASYSGSSLVGSESGVSEFKDDLQVADNHPVAIQVDSDDRPEAYGALHNLALP